MPPTEIMTETQKRQAAIEIGLTQIRLENMEPLPLFFDLAEQYVQGNITIEEALDIVKQAVQMPDDGE